MDNRHVQFLQEWIEELKAENDQIRTKHMIDYQSKLEETNRRVIALESKKAVLERMNLLHTEIKESYSQVCRALQDAKDVLSGLNGSSLDAQDKTKVSLNETLIEKAGEVITEIQRW